MNDANPVDEKENNSTNKNIEEIDDELEQNNEEDVETELERASELEDKLFTTERTEESLEIKLKEMNRNLIEAALYAAGRPLDIEELSTKLEISKKEVEELVNLLAFDYLGRSSALIIAQVGDRFQMQLRPEYTEKVSKFVKGGGISEANLRTLTVIALKQPILKSTVIKIRGTGAYEHVKYLLDNNLISAVKKGRSHELMTTDKYADMFGLPKNKQELKRAMISQLGLEEDEN